MVALTQKSFLPRNMVGFVVDGHILYYMLKKFFCGAVLESHLISLSCRFFLAWRMYDSMAAKSGATERKQIIISNDKALTNNRQIRFLELSEVAGRVRRSRHTCAWFASHSRRDMDDTKRGLQWSLRIKDTLGAGLLSFIWRLSSGGRFDSICTQISLKYIYYQAYS